MRATTSWALCLSLGLAAPAALAGPLDDPHVGGVGFAGPVTGNLASLFWNPAALGLSKGNQAEVSGAAAYERLGIAGADGTATSARWTQPIALPPGPNGLVGASTSFGSDRLWFGGAAFSPYHARASFDTGATGPTRYQAIAFDVRHVALAPGLAARIWRQLRVGASLWLLFSSGSIDVARDTAATNPDADCGGAPCGFGNPAAAATYHVASGFSPFDTSFASMLATGAFIRLGRWDLGANYIWRPFGGDTSSGIAIRAHRSRVERPATSGGGPLPCPAMQPNGCVSAEIAYDLPDMWIAGAAYRLSETTRVVGTFRFVNESAHDRVDVRLFGSSLQASGLPTHLVLGRGLVDSYEGRLGAEWRFRERFDAAVGLRAQTAAVPHDALNPAAIDGFTVEPMAAFGVQATGWLGLRLAYALAWSPAVEVTNSRFDPAAERDCAAAGNDLEAPACAKVRAGFAAPAPLGRYEHLRHTASLAATFHF